MTKQEVIKEIGDVLTQLDAILASPDLDPGSATWQLLYALRKHLDDHQRRMVIQVIATDTPKFASLTAKLTASCAQMDAVANDMAKVGEVIQVAAEIAGVAHQILQLVAV